MKTSINNTVKGRFFAPVIKGLQEARSSRRCPGFSDEDFLLSGIGRAISDARSGRDWIQQLILGQDVDITVSRFFDSLNSSRRLELTMEVARSVQHQLDESCPDSMNPLSEYAELADYAVFASDGHYEAAATHTKPIAGKVYPPQYFCSINLASHSHSLLDIARPAKGKKRENDMKALKRLSTTQLRMGQPKGKKVIHVYDPAGIDYEQWRKWRAKGIYIISREKSNSAAMVVGDNDWNKSDPLNIGVLSDELIGVFAGVLMRRVVYRDPVTSTVYSYHTSEMRLPPGIIAFLYKLRWDIEKKFDEKKNKLYERKAWATSATSKSIQMHMICIAHNLMLMLERNIDAEEGIRDEKVYARRRKRVAQQLARIRKNSLVPNPMVVKCTRITERSLQFIRWLRHFLWNPTSWAQAVKSLAPLMQKYLA